MADSEGAFDNLVAHAHEAHIAVVGGGIAGLIFAYECAKVGIAVTLFEMNSELGGTVASVELDGLRVDTGATSWQAASPEMRDLVADLDLADRVISPASDQTWIADAARGWAAPLPPDTVLGIPANAWDDSVRRIIGWGGTWRAYLDRLRPPLTIGVSRNLGELVRSRMGAKVHDRLVAPLSVGRYGISPDDVDIDVAAPGLNAALTRTGSLGAGVSDLLVDRVPGPTISSLEGGMVHLVAALADRLRELGVTIHADTIVSDVMPTEDGRWQVIYGAGGEAGDEIAAATVVALAADEDLAHDLASQALGHSLTATQRDPQLREVITLVLDSVALNEPTRGTTVYAVPGSQRASGVVHHSARWDWLAREAGVGRHVVSVSFDGPLGEHPTSALDDERAMQLAVESVADLLGITAEPAHVRAMHRGQFSLDRPASARGQAENATEVRLELAEARGLVAVGAWLSGSGLAQVVADAVREADRTRSAVLWGDSAPK
ncbi:protoporphyrinogen/coproporphyrinogen oxidase (plasmid) [Coraliomargarita sp. W4R53]